MPVEFMFGMSAGRMPEYLLTAALCCYFAVMRRKQRKYSLLFAVSVFEKRRIPRSNSGLLAVFAAKNSENSGGAPGLPMGAAAIAAVN
jgi:hypothetical protein